MKKTKIAASILTLLSIGLVFGVNFAKAQTREFSLEAIQLCDIEIAGDDCFTNLRIINNTGKVLASEGFLTAEYQGLCGSGYFDGEGIEPNFSAEKDQWLTFSDWQNGLARVTGFNIAEGETTASVKMETVPNLCPGKYVFNFGLRGEEYIAPAVVIGGGGYSLPTEPLNAEKSKVDANHDDKIDILDFNILMINWGVTLENNVADFNGDGKVDIFDFNLLMINWTY